MERICVAEHNSALNVPAVGLGSVAELDAAVDARVRELLQAAPGAIAAAKALLRAVAGRQPEDVREATAGIIADRRASDEGQEGLQAFLDKRRPRWAP